MHDVFRWTPWHEAQLVALWPRRELTLDEVRAGCGNPAQSTLYRKVAELELGARRRGDGRILNPKQKRTQNDANRDRAIVQRINSANQQPPEPEPEPEPIAILAGAFRIYSIMDLTESTCRWPSGHPGTEDFFYCGSETLPGRPYCRIHHIIAYRPYGSRLETE